MEIYPNTNATDSYSWMEMRTSKFALGSPNFEFYTGSNNTTHGTKTMEWRQEGGDGLLGPGGAGDSEDFRGFF